MNDTPTKDGSSGDNGNDPPNNSNITSGDPKAPDRELFNNTIPRTLLNEISFADANGAKPLSVDEAGFDDVINEGTIKWAVSENGELKIVPKVVNGDEISHAVIFESDPVTAAGEADIVGAQGEYILLDISNNSGHYLASTESLEIGRQAFAKAGII